MNCSQMNKTQIVAKAVLLLAMLASFTAGAGELPPYAGDPVPPPLRLQDLDGASHDLGSLRGKVVVVNFWASWCAPCRQEMPSLWRMQKALRNPALAVVAVNVGDSKQLVRAVLPELMQRDFLVLLDPSRVAYRAWRIRAFPATYVIDTRGRIRYLWYGARQWDKRENLGAIRRLLLHDQ
jgi:thiol-disulfide isomerase/thioredoxin